MRRRSMAIMVIAVAAALGLVSPQLATSAPSQDPRAEREQVRAEQARVASNIDTSRASLGEIDAALQTLDENLRTQQAALARTEEEVAQAAQDIEDSEAAITRLTAEIGTLTEEMRRRAIDSYVNPVGDDVLTVLDTKDFTTATNRKFYIELRAQDDADIADRLEGASKDLDFQKQKATEAKATAEQKQAEQQTRTDAVAAAQAEQEQLSNSLQTTIDSQVARSVELAKTDRALSAKIAEQQAALVARLAAQKAANAKAAREATAAQKAEQARIAKSASSANVSDAGQERSPTPPPAESTGGGGSGGGGGGGGGGATVEPGPVNDGVSISYVQGVPVNSAVAGQVSAMINAAAADGVSLNIGNSYRPVSQQIELRKKNCGSSYYAIYQMSSGSCRPPTAKPGSSQHQLGLAIDFAGCSSRGSACYRWLSGNASRFGYYNLPSEPWHWSTTGR